MLNATKGADHPAARPAGAPGAALHPPVSRAVIRWLDDIRAAHRLTTWAEAAKLVLAEIAADPANPVNAQPLRAADLPAPVRIAGRYGNPAASTILIRPTAEIAACVDRLTRGGGFKSRSIGVAAILRAARATDDGSRYRPRRVAS